MGESTACLLRLYSQPSSSSPQTKQGDTFRCLTSSISFGRYMSESLNWEKWSTFTENRYLEDVKKYSRPGSVAQMKAHFEAHYKKKAAERAEALLEQDNVIQMDNHVAIGKTREDEATRNKDSDSVEVSRCTPRGEGQGPEGEHLVEAVENQLVDQVDISNWLETVEDVQASGCNQYIGRRKQGSTQFPKVDKSFTSNQVDLCGQIEESLDDNGKKAYGDDGKTQSKGIDELGDPASLDKRNPALSRFKSRGHIAVPKPPAPPESSVPIQKRQYGKANSGSREPIQKRQYRKANSGSRENTADVENRKPQKRSFHMSIDLAPKETKKQLSPILQRLVNSRIVKTLAGKAAQATQGKPLQGTVDIPAHPSISLQQRKFSSTKSPERCSRNVQSPTVSRPFSFKSEERAAKRKEFFERLVQNAKAKVTEKQKLQENSKVKPRNDFKYIHLSATSKVGPGKESFRPRTPNNASKVIPAALPSSPFVSREALKDNDVRPPWRLTASCKEVKSVSKKSTCENASPNIQV